ncbi:hypothetical protein [Microscilla marina]|uniref:Uncharacterized protein n=1 Tax=Microscilla marina ATCC 23134 TaxID=313606 RepID=A1ZI36_MICM2|nr:hypothetical protein [Microscilla marina]EAY29704.1 hypothetical protein M23134_05576 [Microscilla marina ATCC 23134]
MIKVLLLLHILIELGAGLLFILAPQAVPGLPEIKGIGLNHLASYGYAALALAALGGSTLFYYYREGALSNGLFTLAIFHSCISIAQINTPLIPSMYIEPMLVHGLFAVLFWRYYWRER